MQDYGIVKDGLLWGIERLHKEVIYLNNKIPEQIKNVPLNS